MPPKKRAAVASATPVNVEETYQAISVKDHVKKKDMWAGVRQCATYNEFICVQVDAEGMISHTFLQANVTYPSALLKCIDEALVNALDHMIEMRKGKDIPAGHKVTEICIGLDKATGVITVFNNGRGIPTDYHNGAAMYTPQLIFGEMFAGSNLDKDKTSITGGTNGVGIKLTNIYSDWFQVETVYGGTKYVQKWTDGANKCDTPTITNASTSPEYTKLTFLPSYASIFECKFADIVDDLSSVLLMRAYMAAAYAGWNPDAVGTRRNISRAGSNSSAVTAGRVTGCSVKYCDVPLSAKNIRDIAAMIYPGAPSVATTMSSEGYTWDVVVVMATNDTKTKKDFMSVSNVNGIYVRGGRHIDHILDQLVAAVKLAIGKDLKGTSYTFKPYLVYSNLAVFVNAQVPNVSWEGQRKDQAIISKTGLAAYKLDDVFVKSVVSGLKDKILQTLCPTGKILGAEALTKQQHDETIAIEKYTPAKFSRDPRKRHLCSLMLPEGDSARGMVSKGITAKAKGASTPMLGFDYYGILTLRGVIINARKNITVSKTGLRMSDKLTKNVFFQNLIRVVGLNLNNRYDPNSATYAAEMKQLKYGCIIGCVDQDHDGVGFIFSLIINIFELFWPKLLEQGFVKRFVTPVRRAYAKRGKEVLEFYSNGQFHAWVEADPAKHNDTNYEIEYIKGLATNTETDIRRMFARFNETLYTYYPDADTPKWYEDLFGKLSAPRKVLLSRDQAVPSDELTESQFVSKKISCSDHALYEAESHKRENLARKLWSPYDGLNESGRKILSGAIRKLSARNTKMKVAELTSFVANSEHYHYGDASLAESIFVHGMTIVGGIQLPFVLPVSGFLDRNSGGSGHGSPRYAKTQLNKALCDVLYPNADMPVLDYVFDDGIRVEPKTFVPILPTAVLESVEMPADGWKIKVWARDVHAVMNVVREMIANIYTDEAIATYVMPQLPPNTFRFKGTLRTIGAKQYSVGTYKYDSVGRVFTITELPLRCWPDTIIETYNKKIKMSVGGHVVQMFKVPPANRSSEDDISIEIELAPPNGGHDPLDIITQYATDEFDGPTRFFGLADNMDSHLNMMTPSGAIKSYTCYEDIIKDWFVVRRDLYSVRFARELAVIAAKIRYMENVIRYILAELKFDIRKVDIDEIDAKLTSMKFDKIHSGAILRPKYRTPDELMYDAFEGPKASFKYLLDITDYERLVSNVTKKQNELADLRRQHDVITNMIKSDAFDGQSMWLSELEQLEQVIANGEATIWGTSDSTAASNVKKTAASNVKKTASKQTRLTRRGGRSARN